MPVALYESMFALDSTKVSADGDAARASITGTLEKYGAELIVARPWDENGKLAYPINKQKKAYFFIVYYKLESTKQAEVEQDLRINENLLRHLTSAIDPKWADTMLEIAKTESGRFAHKGMQDDAAPTGEGIISNDPMVRGGGMDLEMPAAPPRRGRRNVEMSEKPE